MRKTSLLQLASDEAIAGIKLMNANKTDFDDKTLITAPSGDDDLLDSIGWFNEKYFQSITRPKSLSKK